MDSTARLGADLAAARRDGVTIPGRRTAGEPLSLDAAYELGRDLERMHVAAGWRPAGWKLGFTNQSFWSRLGFDTPLCARIYPERLFRGPVSTARRGQPARRPERRPADWDNPSAD